MRGTAQHVVVYVEGLASAVIVRETRHTLVLEPTHYEGESNASVREPTSLGRRARLQLAAVPPAARLPAPEAVGRPLTTTSRCWRGGPMTKPPRATPASPRAPPTAARHQHSGSGRRRAAGPGPGASGECAAGAGRARGGEDLSPLAFLDLSFTGQLERKDERRATTMLELSGLPPAKTLKAFGWGFQPKADRRQIDALSTPVPAREDERALPGPPGVG